MGIQEDGILQEQWLINQFNKKGIHCFQPDVISFENGKYILNETKNQEHYKAPPFDGHGLPKYQIDARISFWNAKDIRCRLIIREKSTGTLYIQWLDILEKGIFFDTKGVKRRRIYPLDAFKKFEVLTPVLPK